MRYSVYIPRPQPEYFDGRIYEPKLNCHICGKPGTWRARCYGWDSVTGEILCDECAKPTIELITRNEAHELVD